ncbi:MAG: D-aminoacylase [Armatimonadetes bacterium]|nr:D-aminoacylase [Armatimonadota bacterium]
MASRRSRLLRYLLFFLLVTGALPTALSAPAPNPGPYDILLIKGRLIDGTGNPWRRADVAIRGDRIVAVGALEGQPSRRVIDASGLVVAPGFIDMLGHSETALLADPRALSKIYQGITSEITGEGGSIAPRVNEPDAPPRSDGLKLDFTTLDGYFRRLEAAKPAINLGTYVGAGALRRMVIGRENRPATPAEMAKMKAYVEEAMKDGAMGLSTALEYAPGAFASTEEIIELARVASKHGGIYASHIRNEGDDLLRSIDEAIRIGREAEIPVEIFHLKVMGRLNWGKMKEAVARIERARENGVDVAADIYPYLAARTGLGATLPPWIFEVSGEALAEKLRDPATRARLKKELAGRPTDWENLYGETGPEGIFIESLPVASLKGYERKTLAQIAAERKQDPMDALLDLLAETKGGGGAFYFAMSEEDLRLAMRQPWVSFGQDAGARNLTAVGTHPRAFGTFARVLGHYVRREGVLTLEEAIRKMTSLPAGRVGLVDRGIVRPGLYADLAVFDPKTIQDRATFLAPAQYAVGMRYVFVNGALELENGKPTDRRGGRPLRGPGYR